MNIRSSTKKFEKWKACRIALVKKDIGIKHREMAASPFPFFRATFYRWLQLWEKECAKEAAAPKVLAVGDLHVENFGTWRDLEGRLIWGVNDFDEAYPMPYTIDLVRLVTSAHLAAAEEHLTLKPRAASEAVLQGYLEGIKSRGLPFVLGENHKWLRQIALNRLRDPVRFWARLEQLPRFTGTLPEVVRRELEAELPEPGLPYLKKRRVAGLGSLGHFRVVIMAEWRGGWIAREAKALCHSSCLWQNGQTGGQILYRDIISRAVRVPDPFLRIREGMLYRRLAPDCSRILLASLPKDHDELRLLRAMGFETANIHLGSRRAVPAILRDLKRRPEDWLHRAARRMAKAVVRDWEEWSRTD
jgi:hypothetical protein